MDWLWFFGQSIFGKIPFRSSKQFLVPKPKYKKSHIKVLNRFMDPFHFYRCFLDSKYTENATFVRWFVQNEFFLRLFIFFRKRWWIWFHIKKEDTVSQWKQQPKPIFSARTYDHSSIQCTSTYFKSYDRMFLDHPNNTLFFFTSNEFLLLFIFIRQWSVQIRRNRYWLLR